MKMGRMWLLFYYAESVSCQEQTKEVCDKKTIVTEAGSFDELRLLLVVMNLSRA